MTGIYLITNTITENRYIGQSVDIARRIQEHMTPHSSLATKGELYKEEFIKYGPSAFRSEVLEECDKSQLDEREKAWIRKLKPEYNIRKDGYTVSAERREKIRQTLKKRWRELPEEEKQHVLNDQLIGPKKGHKVSQETRQKLREHNLGRRTYGVYVIETDTYYEGAQECAAALGVSYWSVLNQLVGKTKTTKGYHLKRVETNRDECSGVGRRREPVEVRGNSMS